MLLFFSNQYFGAGGEGGEASAWLVHDRISFPHSVQAFALIVGTVLEMWLMFDEVWRLSLEPHK